jgi:hypothetical protein
MFVSRAESLCIGELLREGELVCRQEPRIDVNAGPAIRMTESMPGLRFSEFVTPERVRRVSTRRGRGSTSGEAANAEARDRSPPPAE